MDEDPWLARIQRAVDAVHGWEDRTQRPESPDPGSALAGDDQLNPQHPASLVAWSSIGTAVDHLGLAADSLEREGGARLRPTAFYTVCRSALVAASQAVWVMTGNRQARLQRVRWCEAEEHLGRSQLLRDYLNESAFQADVSPEFHREVGDLRDRSVERRKRVLAEINGKSFTVTGMLQDVAAIVAADDPWLARAYAFEWRMSSGGAHARLWPQELRPGHKLPVLGTSTTLRYTTGSTETYGQSLGAATLVTSEAFRLWDERRVSSATTDSD
ncbi:hypothetical protein NF556_00090 [Ornithinimicrobium faecis]|uniref:Mycothiol-dependent maleylpyruvate isomerase metal-binding domain-containing protein n=1 Tax=Ornithinimicrobium faecis TaxID=2934158 RepID=A0ABY4YTK9_9MICO|nr:hypothetical protein [Ornithinimicrobium sp. HY1793]USQ80101.1 hypothetical protein NF556_00090 [Ornithinimicrobium sp. HY1793]